MFIANDFINRLSADPGALPPHVKSEVCDENFKKIIATSGAHQRLLDVSHCTSLTTKGFGVIRACTTLQFLDVSYTNIRDLNFLQVTCSVLKGLNIAGLNLKYYDFIGKLDSLEILILRESTFKKGDTLKDLLLLRSLDIAYTEVDDLTPLYNFERLEELYLDGCPSLCKIIHDDVIDVLGRWPNLRMLNMSDCGFIPDWEPETVMQIPNTELFIDSFSHMSGLFDAILVDDDEAARNVLETGVHVSCRSTDDTRQVLAQAWLDRCNGRVSKYFALDHEDHSMRPTPLHVAIYFNAMKCVRMLLLRGADINLECLVGDSEFKQDRVQLKDKIAKEGERTIFNAVRLTKMINEKAIHRYADSKIPRNDPYWEDMCDNNEAALIKILDDRWLKERIPEAVEDAPIETEASASTTPGGSGIPGGELFSKRGMSTREFSKRSFSQRSISSSMLQATSSAQSFESVGNGGEILELQEISEDEVVDESKLTEEEREELQRAREEQAAAERKEKRRLKLMKQFELVPKEGLHPWRDNGMAKKLLGAPYTVKSSMTGRSTLVMGKRSYWGEVKTRVISDAIRADEMKFAAKRSAVRAQDQRYKAYVEAQARKQALKEERELAVAEKAPSEEIAKIDEELDEDLGPAPTPVLHPGLAVIYKRGEYDIPMGEQKELEDMYLLKEEPGIIIRKREVEELVRTRGDHEY